MSVPLAVLFALSPPLVVAAVRDGRVPDPLTALVMCAGALAIVRRRPVWLGGALLVGVANHEAALWLVPWAYAAWARRLLDRRALAEVALCAAPALAAWAALRLSIPSVGREQVRGYGSLLGGRLDVLEAAAQEPAGSCAASRSCTARSGCSCRSPCATAPSPGGPPSSPSPWR